MTIEDLMAMIADAMNFEELQRDIIIAKQRADAEHTAQQEFERRAYMRLPNANSQR